MPVFNEVSENIARFDKQAKPQFLQFFENRMSLLMSDLGPVVSKEQSDGPSERYPFFGATPLLEEYKGDNYPVFDLSDYETTIANRTYGGAMAVRREYFEDIGRMPGALDSLVNRVSDGLAARGVLLIEKLIADVLLESAPFNAMASPDGQVTGLFQTAGSGHFDDNIVNELANSSGFDPSTLQSDDDDVNELFATHKDDTGNFIRSRAPSRKIILCDPKRARAYSELYRAQSLAIGLGSAGGSAPDNVLRDGGGMGMRTTVLPWAFLSGQDKTFYVDVSDEVPGPRAVVWQERIPFALESMTIGSEHTTLSEQLFYKNRGRVGFFMGHPAKVILVPKA